MTDRVRRPRPGEFYRHFKGNLYQIIAIAIHSETGEEMVVYQALYHDFKVYTRPLTMFVSDVDSVKYPNVKQKERFCLIESILENEQAEDVISIETNTMVDENKNDKKDEILLQFLEAKTCKDKLDVLMGIKNHLTELMLQNMMISLDLAVMEGTKDEYFEIVRDHLQARARFENSRLR